MSLVSWMGRVDDAHHDFIFDYSWYKPHEDTNEGRRMGDIKNFKRKSAPQGLQITSDIILQAESG